MQLKNPMGVLFHQLTESLHQLSTEEYIQPIGILFNASIGQHVRHIIELLQCLEAGYESGVVNYEKRKRNRQIECSRELAIRLIHDIYHRLDRPNIELKIEAAEYAQGEIPVLIPSNYYREVAYNLEHTIHHMAIIRIGITEISSICMPDSFGMAFSTLKFREQLTE